MDKNELRSIVDSIPLTQQEIASAIGVSHGHLRNSLSGGQNISRSAQILLRLLSDDQSAHPSSQNNPAAFSCSKQF